MTGERRSWVAAIALVGAALLAALPGLLGGPAGPLDIVAFLSWGALIAPAAGALIEGTRSQGTRNEETPDKGALPEGTRPEGPSAVSRARVALVRHASPLLVLVLALFFCQSVGPRTLPSPWLGGLVLGGLYLGGAGLAAFGLGRPQLGRSRSRLPEIVGAAGLLLVGMLLLSGGPLLYGFAGEGQSLGRTHPGAAEALLLLAPDGLALEVSGFDWSHTNPAVYATSGVEWLERTPRGALAACMSLAGGLLVLAVGRGRSAGRRGAASS